MNFPRTQLACLLLSLSCILVACDSTTAPVSNSGSTSTDSNTSDTGTPDTNTPDTNTSGFTSSGENEQTEQNPNQIAPQAWYEEAWTCGPKSIAWADVNDWFYQLQVSDYEVLANSKYDLLVIDGDPRQYELNRNVVERMKCGGDGDKFLVAYVSVGQAENYREYWQDNWDIGNPSWIASADEVWLGDYYVRYWNPEWQNILLQRVDEMVDKGFDALYLDVIDAYYEFESERPQAREDMRSLIATIAQRARIRSANPDFGIFVQNAEELIDENYVGASWVEPLTGIGKEEPFYWAMDDKVKEDQRYWNDYYLSQWVAAGKLVLNVDYVTQTEYINEVYSAAKQRGYVPLTLKQKALDQFEIVPGHEPD